MISCTSLSQAEDIPGVFHIVYRGATEWDAYVEGDSLPATPIADVQSQMWEEIKAERDRRKLEGGYMVAVSGVNKWFHSDTFSRTQQIGLVMMGAGIPAGLQWKTMDGSFVTMTQALANAIFSAAAAQDQATFAQAETHHANMLAAADPASYDYLGGWPAIYGG